MKGILFKPDMIKAIVEGRKTVTRRVMQNQPVEMDKVYYKAFRKDYGCRVPRYQIGEVVYIKEAHRYIQNDGDPYDFGIQYKLDSQVKWWRDNGNLMDYPIDEKWRSPLFLKELFARHFIKITDVRAERLREISEEDAIASGISPEETPDEAPPAMRYASLWDSINPKYPWELNPFVFTYKFVKVDKLP